ncbi:MFS transporter [Bradyrhizobium genosp. L]|nr:MFS transporter [Bradyrhizobium genosp. L]
MTARSVDDHARLYRKVFWRLIPFIILLYLICYIDRVNIGFAKLQFLSDLGLNDAHYGVASGLFFVTYCLFDIPSNLMLARIGVRKTLLRIMVFWGMLTAMQMFIRSAGELYVLRLLFGAAEAGFLPGVMLYLTYWFPDQYKARMTSLFFAGVPMAGIVGGPLSGMIMQSMDGLHGLRGWQWLFLLEGLPAIAMGIVAYLYLDDAPDKARWLSDAEKRMLQRDLDADRLQNPKGTQHSFVGVLRDPLIYVMALVNVCVNCGINAVNFWTPSLLKSAGMTGIGGIGWTTGLISAISALAMIAVGRSSDRMMERRWHYAGCAILGAIGFVGLPFIADDVVATAALLTLAAVGNTCAVALYWTIPTSYLKGKGAAGGIAAVSMAGAIGSGISPPIIGWLKVQTGSLPLGLAVIAIFGLVGVVLVLTKLPAKVSPETKVKLA